MGSCLSSGEARHVEELQFLTHKAKCPVAARDLRELVEEVNRQCPWYPDLGTPNPEDRQSIGLVLRSKPRTPIRALHSWFQCRHAIKQQIPDCSKAAADLVSSSPAKSPLLSPPACAMPVIHPPCAPVISPPSDLPLPALAELREQELSLQTAECLKAELQDKKTLSTENADLLALCPAHFTEKQDQDSRNIGRNGLDFKQGTGSSHPQQSQDSIEHFPWPQSNFSALQQMLDLRPCSITAIRSQIWTELRDLSPAMSLCDKQPTEILVISLLDNKV
uniref:Uncharacterized protein n=1 Tax=Sphaerodactylus townsendi TaxID=933632 RepID=A0ACB8FBW8_9SAUR